MFEPSTGWKGSTFNDGLPADSPAGLDLDIPVGTLPEKPDGFQPRVMTRSGKCVGDSAAITRSGIPFSEGEVLFMF
jgi:hypothetical protein